MRLFVAVTPPAAELQRLDQAVGAVRRQDGGPRWTPMERWHITLAFLGEVDEAAPDALTDQLAAITAAPMTLRLVGAGTFPRSGPPQVLWVGLDGDLDALGTLAKNVSRAAKSARIRLDRKAFRPHLTIGRWRRGDPADRATAAALASYQGNSFDVTEMALIRSHLGPKPRYETLQTFRFG